MFLHCLEMFFVLYFRKQTPHRCFSVAIVTSAFRATVLSLTQTQTRAQNIFFSLVKIFWLNQQSNAKKMRNNKHSIDSKWCVVNVWDGCMHNNASAPLKGKFPISNLLISIFALFRLSLSLSRFWSLSVCVISGQPAKEKKLKVNR